MTNDNPTVLVSAPLPDDLKEKIAANANMIVTTPDALAAPELPCAVPQAVFRARNRVERSVKSKGNSSVEVFPCFFCEIRCEL